MRNSRLRTGLKDNWNAFMVKDASFSDNDIPFCPTRYSAAPKKIVTWTEAKHIHKIKNLKDKDYSVDALICFYIDDYKFDGKRSSIWTFPDRAFRVIKHFKGIITPDFSTYQDFPHPIKLYNTYRMRAFGHWIWEQGYDVINNVRWGLEDTYRYCFDGIEKNSVIAIGTVGGSPRRIKDRARFEEGLYKMVQVLSPQTIIVYGSDNYPCFEELRNRGIQIVSFPSETSASFMRRRDVRV